MKGRIVSGLERQAETLKPEKSQEEKSTEDKPKESTDEDVEGLSVLDKKKIGDWGETLVFYALQKEIIQRGIDVIATDFGFKGIDDKSNEIEIVWLNVNNNVGKGYDFVRKENGIEVEYIEVKSKLQSGEELIEITGTQWEFARTLYDKGEGQKYFIYIVSNTGQTNAKIRKLNNPIALWKEGRLYAHPVNFRL